MFGRHAQETAEDYDWYEGLVLRLFESFRYLYEPLGRYPEPAVPEDLHVYPILRKAGERGAKNLDGSCVTLPDDRDPFGEESHSHLTRHLTLGSSWSNYQVAGDNLGGWHNGGDEIYIVKTFPLLYLVSADEIGGYVFPTDNNYFEESANRTVLTDRRYNSRPAYPVYHSRHKEIFTPEYFEKIHAPATLLNVDFSFGSGAVVPDNVRVLHFALKLLYSAILLDSAMRELFGDGEDKADRIAFIDRTWQYPVISRRLSLHHLAVLSALLAPLHYVAYAFTYALYRNKFGVSYQELYPEGKSLHGGWYFGRGVDRIAFKDALKQAVLERVQHWTELLGEYEQVGDKSPEAAEATDRVKHCIRAACDLAGWFGIGYRTSPWHEENPHYDEPFDFQPQRLQRVPGLDLKVGHRQESVFFRFWYQYTGDFFSAEELQHILGDRRTGKTQESPWAVLLMHSYSYMKNYQFSFMQQQVKRHKADILGELLS